MYEGESIELLRHGKGKYRFPNGRIYDGDWNRDCIEGNGILYDENWKIIYKGEWKKNEFDGCGVLYNNALPFQEYKELYELDPIGLDNA